MNIENRILVGLIACMVIFLLLDIRANLIKISYYQFKSGCESVPSASNAMCDIAAATFIKLKYNTEVSDVIPEINITKAIIGELTTNPGSKH